MRGVLADDLVQGPVEQVGDGVVALDGGAAGAVNGQGDGGAGGRECRIFRLGIFSGQEMEPGVARFLGVGDAPELAAGAQFAGVADLAAHLGVERRGVEDDGGLVLDADDFEDFGGASSLS